MRVMLMLSGGKDSCALAHILVDKHGADNVLLVTVDHGFMSEIALQNINRLVEQTKCEHVMHKDSTTQLGFVQRFFAEKMQRMQDVCGPCTMHSNMLGLECAYREKIRLVYTGATASNFLGGIPVFEKGFSRAGVVIRVWHPFIQEYDYSRVVTLCRYHGYEWNPTKTNCKMLRSILRLHYNRFRNVPYLEEINTLYESGQIDETHFRELMHFCTGSPKYKDNNIF